MIFMCQSCDFPVVSCDNPVPQPEHSYFIFSFGVLGFSLIYLAFVSLENCCSIVSLDMFLPSKLFALHCGYTSDSCVAG